MLTLLFLANCFQSHCLDPNGQDLGAHWVRWGAEGGLCPSCPTCHRGVTLIALNQQRLQIRDHLQPASPWTADAPCLWASITAFHAAFPRQRPSLPGPAWGVFQSAPEIKPLASATTFQYFQGLGVNTQGLSPKPGVGWEEATGKPENEQQRS